VPILTFQNFTVRSHDGEEVVAKKIKNKSVPILVTRDQGWGGERKLQKLGSDSLRFIKRGGSWNETN